jgi:hypothetical protein
MKLCSICEEAVASWALREHHKKNHKNNLIEISESIWWTTIPDTNGKWSCYCGNVQPFSRKDALKYHMQLPQHPPPPDQPDAPAIQNELGMHIDPLEAMDIDSDADITLVPPLQSLPTPPCNRLQSVPNPGLELPYEDPTEWDPYNNHPEKLVEFTAMNCRINLRTRMLICMGCGVGIDPGAAQAHMLNTHNKDEHRQKQFDELISLYRLRDPKTFWVPPIHVTVAETRGVHTSIKAMRCNAKVAGHTCGRVFRDKAALGKHCAEKHPGESATKIGIPCSAQTLFAGGRTNWREVVRYEDTDNKLWNACLEAMGNEDQPDRAEFPEEYRESEANSYHAHMRWPHFITGLRENGVTPHDFYGLCNIPRETSKELEVLYLAVQQWAHDVRCELFSIDVLVLRWINSKNR